MIRETECLAWTTVISKQRNRLIRCVQKNKGKRRGFDTPSSQTFKSTPVDRTNLTMECPYKRNVVTPLMLCPSISEQYYSQAVVKNVSVWCETFGYEIGLKWPKSLPGEDYSPEFGYKERTPDHPHNCLHVPTLRELSKAGNPRS